MLAGLQSKTILLPATVLEIEAGLAERDTLPGAHPALSPISPNANKHPQPDSATPFSKPNGASKRSIEQRIEEDRERHKKLRESIWVVGEPGGESEFEKLWEEADGIGEDDWVAAEEDAVERRVVGDVL